MSILYRFLLVWSEFDLAIARSTGRSPEHIRQLERDCDKWGRALLLLEINHG